jgi:hypothetical protein
MIAQPDPGFPDHMGEAMKTNDPLPCQLPVSACLLFAIAATSCQTHSEPPTVAVRQTVMRKNWVKVSSQPPTFYPKGVAANSPTDHWSGEWVDTGDENGTRYFIPLRGISGTNRQMLVKEALSQRSERKLAVIAAEDDEILARNIRNMALFGPPVYGTMILGMMVGVPPSGEVDIYRLQKEWHTAREPH